MPLTSRSVDALPHQEETACPLSSCAACATRVMLLPRLAQPLPILGLVFACGSLGQIDPERDDVATCEDLSDVCPPNTVPVAKKAAQGECGADFTFKPESRSFALGGICRAKGECEVVCLVTESQCQCGVDTITRDSVTCNTCPTCGNGIKEPGEQCDVGARNGTNGCSAACFSTGCPDQDRRCSGSHVQLCIADRWTEEADCAAQSKECKLGMCVPGNPMGGNGACAACSETNCVNGACYSTTCCTSAGNCTFSDTLGSRWWRVDEACLCVDIFTSTIFNGKVCIPKP